MKVVFLGTTGYHPNDRRHTTCVMIPELGIVFDAGTAMYRIGRHLATDHLDIFLSHAHLDHVIGLTYLLDIMHQHPLRRVTVHGDASKLAAIREHLFSELLFPIIPEATWSPLSGPVCLESGCEVRCFPLEHPGGVLGFLCGYEERTLAYVTDTTARSSAPYVNEIRNVDLLIHECNFSDEHAALAEMTGHSCTTPVAQVAAAAKVKRLVLIHLNPLDDRDDPVNVSKARAVFPATEVARDEMVVDW